MIDNKFHFNFKKTAQGNSTRGIKAPVLTITKRNWSDKIYIDGSLNTYGYELIGAPKFYVRGFDFKNKCIAIRAASKEEIRNGSAYSLKCKRSNAHIPLSGFLSELTKTGFFKKKYHVGTCENDVIYFQY